MKVAVIIPARYGSTRFPGKPLAMIQDKPMIQHVYERALLADGVDLVVVATDDERIREAVGKFSGKAVMTGINHLSGTDRVCEAAEKLGLDPGDGVINVQGDLPVIPPEMISEMARTMRKKGPEDMITFAAPLKPPLRPDDPNTVKVVFDKNGMALYFSRAMIPWPREEKQTEYFRHIGIYGYSLGFLKQFVSLPEGSLESREKLEQLRAMENGFSIKVLLAKTTGPDVDMPEDISLVEKFLRANDVPDK